MIEKEGISEEQADCPVGAGAALEAQQRASSQQAAQRERSKGCSSRQLTGARQRKSQEAPAMRRRATELQQSESQEAPAARRGATGRRTSRQKIGQRAEDIAAEFLRMQGVVVLERNYRRRLGELDIIARDGDVLIIAEVRTRSSNRYGGAAASVDGRKQQRLIRAAAQFLQQRKDFSHLRVRFDVLAVSETGAGSPQVQWLQHAFLT